MSSLSPKLSRFGMGGEARVILSDTIYAGLSSTSFLDSDSYRDRTERYGAECVSNVNFEWMSPSSIGFSALSMLVGGCGEAQSD